MPLEGYPTSVIPHWNGTEVRVLASPALGAGFVQYMLDVQPGGGTKVASDGETEIFFYLLDGEAELGLEGGESYRLAEGGYALIPRTSGYSLSATSRSRIVALRKHFEPAPGMSDPDPVIGKESDVPAEIWLEIEGSRLQTLIPDDPRFDIAMNIFTFEPGYSLPVVETHVMEHGLYFMQGKGLYYLDEEWMEVEEGDFIWMGPYVPQSFYATGTVASKYLYYKNVNREIPLQ